MKKFFSNGLNIIWLIVALLYTFDQITVLAAFAILVLSVLFYIEEHLRKILVLTQEKARESKGFDRDAV